MSGSVKKVCTESEYMKDYLNDKVKEFEEGRKETNWSEVLTLINGVIES